MNTDRKTQCRKMIGKSYLYMGTEHEIQEVTPIEGDLFAVRTDKRTIKVSWGEIRSDFIPVTSRALEVRRQQVFAGLQVESNQMTALAATLLKKIEKTEKDPAFIDRARAINDQAKTLIDLKRLQLDILKTAIDVRDR